MSSDLASAKLTTQVAPEFHGLLHAVARRFTPSLVQATSRECVWCRKAVTAAPFFMRRTLLRKETSSAA